MKLWALVRRDQDGASILRWGESESQLEEYMDRNKVSRHGDLAAEEIEFRTSRHGMVEFLNGFDMEETRV